jgi:hypothetical protein
VSKEKLNGEVVKPMEPAEPGLRIQDEDSRRRWPTLFTLLDARWEGNKCVYEGGVLSIRPEGNAYRVAVAMPTYKAERVLLCFTLATIFDDLEQALATGVASRQANFEGKKEARQRFMK